MADVKVAFVAKECTHTITPSTDKDASPATEKEKAEALRYLKAHIDPNLLWGYQHMMCPKELWDALASRFGSIEDCILPQLNEQWNDIQFLDYVKQVDQLIAVAKRHNEVLANNNARATGKKKIPESNYGKDNKGKYPKEKRVKNVDSYSHAPYSRGNNNPRGRGQRGHRGRGHGREGHGRGGHGHGGHGRGGHSNTWSRDVTSGPSGRGNTVEKTHKNSMYKKVENENAPCYRCGISVHWYQQCKASAKVAASYKKHRESIDQESHCVEEHDHSPDVNFTISDFQGNKNHALMETPDFD
ncbi:uncharacterized protein LOC113311908 [Papaver somniferum]|uniref:uncharacterized protein LOC113311908 n=1 Tax=Papaver somniferum TaxID=3469 RepID=UPI000E6F54BD|nr:uncharacterized protein LOC113311908 [Papaver somniferum]